MTGMLATYDRLAGTVEIRTRTQLTPVRTSSDNRVADWVASQSCCNFAAASVPFAVSLCGCHLLPFGLWFARLVAKPVEALAVDLRELDPVAGVVDLEVETAQTSERRLCSPGNLPITFVLRFTSPSVRSSRFVERQRLRCRSG